MMKKSIPILVMMLSLTALMVSLNGCNTAKAAPPPPTTATFKACCQVSLEDEPNTRAVRVWPRTELQIINSDVTEWSSRYGTITETGLYTAPDHSIMGLDEVVGKRLDGTYVWAYIKVLGDQEDYQPIVVPSSYFDTADGRELKPDTLEQYPTVQAWSFSSLSSFGEFVIEGQPLPIQPVTPSSEALISMGTNTYIVPSYSTEGFVSSTTMTVVNMTDIPQQKKPKMVDISLIDKLPKGDCTGLPRQRKIGPWSIVAVKDKWSDLASVEVKITAEIANKILKWFGIKLEVDSKFEGKVMWRTLDWTASAVIEEWKCIDKKWKLFSRRICTRQGTGVECVPSWWCIIIGYPKGGAPVNWSTPMECKETVKPPKT